MSSHINLQVCSSSMIYLLLFAWIGNAIAQLPDAFAADVRIYNDTNVAGILTGRMFFHYNNRKLRIDYDIGTTEIIDFDTRVRYFGCSGTCDAEIYSEFQPKFFTEGSDSSTGDRITVEGRTCNGYSKPKLITDIYTTVETIWVDTYRLPCRAQFTDGKTIDFTNLTSGGGAGFDEYRNWDCPQPECNKMMDVMLVLDESDSLSDTYYRQLKDFAESLSNKFYLSPKHVMMGVVFFGSEARVFVELTVDKQSVLDVFRNETQRGGTSCIACGVSLAHQKLTANGRTNVSKVMIVVAAGPNSGSNFTAIVDSAKGDGITIYAIGVYLIQVGEIMYLSTDIPGVATHYFPPEFELTVSLNPLVETTCIGAGTRCGPECRGFCSCGATCLCLNTCDDGNACTHDDCDPFTATCVNTPFNLTIDCDDNKQCTNDTCDSTVGCVHTPLDGSTCSETETGLTTMGSTTTASSDVTTASTDITTTSSDITTASSDNYISSATVVTVGLLLKFIATSAVLLL